MDFCLIFIFCSMVFYVANSRLLSVLFKQHSGLYVFLYKKWYFDEIYTTLIIVPVKHFGNLLWIHFDGKIINKFINFVSLALVPSLSKNAATVQTGFVTHYAFAMILGLVAITILLSVFISF